MNEKKEDILRKNNDVIIYYALNTDSNSIEGNNKRNPFNLELKRMNITDNNSNKVDFTKTKIKKFEFFEEFFKYKIKKVENKTKPTPFQMFIREKEHLKALNDFRIKQNINPSKNKIKIINSPKNLKAITTDIKKDVINKHNSSKLLLKHLSPSLYLKKIKNYKKNNNIHEKIKPDLYHYFISANNKRIFNNNHNKKINNNDILEFFKSNNIKPKIRVQKSVKSFNTKSIRNIGINNESKIRNSKFASLSRKKLIVDKSTNTNINISNINTNSIYPFNTNSIYHFNTNSICHINTLPSYKFFKEKNVICALHPKFEQNIEHLNEDNNQTEKPDESFCKNKYKFIIIKERNINLNKQNSEPFFNNIKEKEKEKNSNKRDIGVNINSFELDDKEDTNKDDENK
jgi:hypothetical protein